MPPPKRTRGSGSVRIALGSGVTFSPDDDAVVLAEANPSDLFWSSRFFGQGGGVDSTESKVFRLSAAAKASATTCTGYLEMFNDGDFWRTKNYQMEQIGVKVNHHVSYIYNQSKPALAGSTDAAFLLMANGWHWLESIWTYPNSEK